MRTDPFASMRFRVEASGMAETRAVEVVFPSARISVEEGKGRSRSVVYGELVLRRGVTDSREWYDWWDRARRAAPDAARDVAVVLMDASGRDVKRWLFRGAEPTAYQLSPLQALGNEVLTETLALRVGAMEMP